MAYKACAHWLAAVVGLAMASASLGQVKGVQTTGDSPTGASSPTTDSAAATSAAGLSDVLLRGGQASLVVTCDLADVCNTETIDWTISKVCNYTPGSSLITFDIHVTRGNASPSSFTLGGELVIHNGGSAPATIGNIVLNIQRQGACSAWISAAANIADATLGDGATSAKILANASAEDASCNAGSGPGNYTSDGCVGVFTETAGSGSVEFTDVDNNTYFSLVPQPVLNPGDTIRLRYVAEFDNSVLNIPSGAPIRLEALVSFGNAGPRAECASAASDVDINGNGVIDSDEDHIRTVACRSSSAMSEPVRCNETVTLYDPPMVVGEGECGVSHTPNLVLGTIVTDIGQSTGTPGTQVLSNSATFFMIATITQFPPVNESGFVINTACLTSDGGECCEPLDLKTEPTKLCIIECPNCPPPSSSCSHSQGGWGTTCPGPRPEDQPGCIRDAHFDAIYPNGVEVGIPGADGYSMLFTSSEAVNDFLPNGGPSGPLTADLIDPINSAAGNFGAQVLALQLNVDYADAGALVPPSGTAIGDLVLCNTGTSLDGLPVRDILAAANTALGGGALPAGFDHFTFNTIISKLNESYVGCSPTGWASLHLCPPSSIRASGSNAKAGPR